MGILVLKIGLVIGILIILGFIIIIRYRANKLTALLNEMTDMVYNYLNKKSYRAFDAIKINGDYSLLDQLEKDRKMLYSELNKLVDSFTTIVWSFYSISRKNLCGSILKIIEDKKD